MNGGPGRSCRRHVADDFTSSHAHVVETAFTNGEDEKRSVLVVDDNVYLTRATAQALEAQGLQACGAMNATQALKLVAAQEFDGAIIDIDLKGRVDGVELLAAIRELRPGLCAVLTTGHEPGVVDPPEGVMLMRKPYRMSELVAAMFKQDAAA